MKSLQWATICVAICILHGTIAAKLEEIFSWKNVEYNWRSSLDREEAIRNNKHVMKNVVINGFDMWRDKIFIATPRR